MMLRRLSILPLALTVCVAGASAQTLSTDSQIEAGREALGAGNYERAIELLRSVAHANRANAEAHYLLAQAFLGDDRFRAARAEIGKARALDRSNIKFAVAEIEILRASTPPESAISLTDGRRVSLAESLLERDPDNPAALEELGLHHAMNYRWYANFDATKQPLGGGVARKAREEFETSVDFLHRAIDADPARLSAYKELLRLLIEEGEWTAATDLAVSATQAMPSNATSWLLKGLVAQMQNQAEGAAPSFEHAIHLMSDERRKSFTDIGLFLSTAEEAAYHADRQGFTASYWAERDPFLLTEVNERQVDHYARMAYCDLWYGGGATPGWETERGKIVLRYGIPWSDASFIGGYSRFDVLAYRDFEFVFEDITRGGHYTMYSPKAGASSSWTNDYVIQAAEMAISNPEQYDPKLVAPVELLVETSAFRGAGQKSDLYVHVLVPVPSDSANKHIDGSVGAYLLDESENVVDKWVRELDDSRAGGQPLGVTSTRRLRCMPGSYSLGVEYLSADRSSASRVDFEADIPGFGHDTLSVSDLLAASSIDRGPKGTVASGGNSILRSGYAIEPMPWTQVKAGSDLLVYFEIYGLTSDSAGRGSYRIDARVEGAERHRGLARLLTSLFSPRGDSGVSVSSESTSNGSDEPRFLSVGIPPNLPAGEYRLVLDVTDLHNGHTVSRRHLLSVLADSDY